MNLSKSKVFIILSVIVSIEATILLILTMDLGILGSDGEQYNNLALNLKMFSSNLYGSQEPTIFRTIGYPLFLNGLYNIVGHSIFAVRLTQFLLLLFSSYLLFLLAEKYTEKDSAFCSSVFCVTYLPFVFFCLFHLTEILTTFLVILSIFLVVKIEESKSNKLSLLLGLVLGYLSLVRPSFFLFAGLILFAIFISNKFVFNKKLIISISIVIGLILCIIPWTIRNKIVSGEFLLLATGKGVSLYVSAQQYKGEIAYTIPQSDWKKIIQEDDKRYLDSKERINVLYKHQENATLNPKIEFLQDKIYTADALDKFRSITFKDYLFSYPLRIVYLFSTADVAPQHIFIWSHPLAQIQFGALAFFTLMGILIQRKLIFQQYLLWLVPIYIILIHSVFHVEPRYSLPARPFFLIYAGIGFNFLIGRLLKKFAP